jgi:hypothetical protein
VDRSVWIGETLSPLPAGWCAFPSIDEFAASGQSADRIIVNDPAALFREADWLALFAAAPLARIVRRVGPWRAGCERTDPQWPGVVTIACDSVEDLLQQLELAPLPHTAGYDERAARVVDVQLDDVTAVVRIQDPELRAMWEETLRASGAVLATSPEERGMLRVTDGEASHGCVWIIRLAPDPWNVGNGHSSCMARTLTPGPSPGGRGEEEGQLNVIVASVLDSPTTVLARFVLLQTSGSPLPAPKESSEEGPGVRVRDSQYRSSVSESPS